MQGMQGKIFVMANQNTELAASYEALLRNSNLKIYEKGQREAGLRKIIESYQAQLKHEKKRRVWNSISKWFLAALAGWLALK